MLSHILDNSYNFEVRELEGSRVVDFDLPLNENYPLDHLAITLNPNLQPNYLETSHDSLSSGLLLASLTILAVSGKRRDYRNR